MISKPSQRDVIALIGRDYSEARVRLEDVRDELRAVIRVAAKDGITEADLARLSGVTRVTIRKWLGKDGGLA